MYQIGNVTRVEAPDLGDPVLTLAEVKSALRIDGTEFDDQIPGWVSAAAEAAQVELNRQLVDATFEVALDGFPAYEIWLARGPRTLTSVSYVDQAGATQVLDPANYVADLRTLPGRVTLADGYVWPSTRRQPNAVIVRYVAGFGAAAAVPASIKRWMLLHCGTSKKLVESVIVGITVAELPSRHTDGLLDPWRIQVA